MSDYQVSSRILHDWYHNATNSKAKQTYRDLLEQRAQRGSSKAKFYLDKIDGIR